MNHFIKLVWSLTILRSASSLGIVKLILARASGRSFNSVDESGGTESSGRRFNSVAGSFNSVAESGGEGGGERSRMAGFSIS